jgi:hypothetical protein
LEHGKTPAITQSLDDRKLSHIRFVFKEGKEEREELVWIGRGSTLKLSLPLGRLWTNPLLLIPKSK